MGKICTPGVSAFFICLAVYFKVAWLPLMRRFRGHGWSKQGTKKSRRMHRERRAKKYFYVVAVGRRPGIYQFWKNAKPQVHHFSGSVYKKFLLLEDAKQFLKENRANPAMPRNSTTSHTPEP